MTNIVIELCKEMISGKAKWRARNIPFWCGT